MASTKVIALLLQSLILFVVKVHEELDEATSDNMREHEMEINQEMTRMMEEMERRSRVQSSVVPLVLQEWLEGHSILAWEAVLFAAIAAGLILLFWLCWWLLEKIPERDSGYITYETSDMSTDKEDEEESDGEGPEELQEGDRNSARHIEWPVEKMLSRSPVVMQVVDNLVQVMQEQLSNSFMPMLQPPIGVGSTFEGWSPYEADDVIYHLLLPLKPPTGHDFHLQWVNRGPSPARDSLIRVEVQCSCGVPNMLCFLHSSTKQLKTMKQVPSTLDRLCTGSYLDVEKLAEWFQCSVKDAWVALHWAQCYEVKVLPYSHRSCLLKLKSASRNTFLIEILFGVQQGDSDIFLSSQNAGDTDTPSTLWTMSYVVAEVKFFSHMARKVPQGNFHLKCLHLCTSVLEDTNFTPYIFKTVVMHLLNTKPVSGWCRQECIMRLADILRYLHCCLQHRKLNFFFFGNAEMPQEIILPPDFHTSEPHNLLQHLVQSPAAHAEALRQFEEIMEELMNRLYYGGLNRL
ncbi:inositol 1,4,5-trisphosphate receptor-interacting protein-like 1 [Pogoniulus pusillus]|uniref:inositol 1,4,5-trisphosphate receptor-interacting protein-like 1 n=1 Tax=Pogoniulus pusillus TaxID=488313 RepID=UPI0030B979F1